MRITIKNVLGCREADITAQGVTLLCATNAAGKTSALTAIRQALTAEPLPDGIIKKDAGRVLIHKGAKTASVTLHHDADNAVRIVWPTAEVATKGTPPYSDGVAAGLVSLLDMPPASRAAFLAAQAKSEPTEVEFYQHVLPRLLDLDMETQAEAPGKHARSVASKACPDLNLELSSHMAALAHASEVWAEICKAGWHAAHEQAKAGTKSWKASWRAVAGETWGIQKGADWLPERLAMQPDLTGETAASIAADKTSRLDEAVRACGATEADISRLRALAEKQTEPVEALRFRRGKLHDALQEAEADLAAAPVPHYHKIETTCPCCGEALSAEVKMKDGRPLPASVKLEKVATTPMTSQIEADRAAYQDAEHARDKARRALADIDRLIAEAEQIEQARGDLAQAEAGRNAEAEAERAAAAQALEDAEADLKAVNARDKAAALHRTILANLAVAEVTAPDGLRQTKLSDVLELLNTKLATLAEAAGWRQVVIHPDLTPTVDGIIIREPFLSESEVWRARVLLQIAMGQGDLLVIDRADVLDAKQRSGLIRALKADGRAAIVAMTLGSPEKTPAKFSAGPVYWIDAGIVRPLGDVLAERLAAE